ncbi:MAG: caspase family protein [Deltaproteobacteria bacterium]|nr:caspase family protein [Deltaproteobacteria bacterium]
MSPRAMLTLLVCALAFPGAAQASTRRIALLLGSNQGSAVHRPLRFAEQDAQKLGEVLTELGDVDPRDLMLLRGPSLAAVRAAFADATRRVSDSKSRGERTVLIVFYSGHSDGIGLELASEQLAFSELRHLMDGTSADVRLGIVDSCKSGALLAAKGGTPGAAFELRLSSDETSTGTVLLTSSAADEQALESREIGGSFFTHHLVSGLRGAADQSGDGRVTLTEAYEYAFARTVRATADTLAGAQHPSFDYRLSGQGDLVLTELSTRSAGLTLPKDATRALAIDPRTDRVVAELVTGGSPRVALSPGSYLVRLWHAADAREGKLELTAGHDASPDWAQLTAVEAHRATGKGDALSTELELDPLDARNAITFDPLFLIAQTFSVNYQRVLAPSWALTAKARGGVLPKTSWIYRTFQGGGPGATILGASLELNWFPQAQAPAGFFLGSGADVFRIAQDDTAAVVIPNVELGYSWLWRTGFTLTALGGVQYASVFHGTVFDETQLGFFPRLALHVGYAW